MVCAPGLHSTSIQSGEGFYRAFSESFKQAVLTTTVTNKEWRNGSAYSTQDSVFIPSTTELGDTEHNRTYPIGNAYAYFQRANDAKRVAVLGGEVRLYWMRSPGASSASFVRIVRSGGSFGGLNANRNYSVRPALNLES